MKIILLTGNASNQKALANKVANAFDLVGLVIEKKPGNKQKLTVTRVLNKIRDLFYFSDISKAWSNMLEYYAKKYPEFPQTDALVVDNINAQEVIDYIIKMKPDVVMVSGTSLIKKPFFVVKPAKGIVNLHTGLSPYIKGGPNCTNWCLATDQFHLIGNTIMWLDEGIDSGNIITTEFVEFDGTEDLNTIHIKVMEAAHDLYLRALKAIDKKPSEVPSVKQSEINKGTLYLTKMWTDDKKTSLLKNIKNGRFMRVVKHNDFKAKQQEVITVPLPQIL